MEKTPPTPRSGENPPGIIVHTPNDGYEIIGDAEIGRMPVSATAYRGAPESPLGRLEWVIVGGPMVADGIYNKNRDAEEYTVSRILEVPYTAQESRSLQIWVWNRWDSGRAHNVRKFFFRDRTAPVFEITAPGEGETVRPGKVRLEGWVEDRQSGVAGGELRIGGGPGQPLPLTPDVQNPFRFVWRLDLELAAGEHTFQVRFADKKGNRTPVHLWTLRVEAPTPYVTEEDLGSLRAYLADLLDYAALHVQTDEGPATPALLTQYFFQPFADLVDFDKSAAAAQPVNQLRAAIEVLRRYLDAAPATLPPPLPWETEEGAPVPPLESAYCRAAYRALLDRFGASEEEIRLARGADEAARQGLSERLGLLPADLDHLWLSEDQLSEAALETFFGLAVTHPSPLPDTPPPDPVQKSWLFNRRQEALEARWREQDRLQFNQTPLLEPDVVAGDHLRRSVVGNPAVALWETRREALDRLYHEYRGPCETFPDQLAGFDEWVNRALQLPVATLLQLAERRQEGENIDADLRRQGLSPRSFTRLLRLRALAGRQLLTPYDWDEFCHLLLAVEKQRRYPVWVEEEQNGQLYLSPRFFQPAEVVPSLLPWRATYRQQQDWEDLLQSRLRQREALEKGVRAAVSAVEEQTLPLLRDALVGALAQQWNLPATELAERLSHRLQIDLQTNASQRSTRLIQAMETLQSLLFALRAGQLAAGYPAAGWTLVSPGEASTPAETHFDQEWQWMGSYASWRSAMFVFFFPETVLLPGLRNPYDPEQPLHPQRLTRSFGRLLAELRKQAQLTPAQALHLAGQYLDDLLEELGELEKSGVATYFPPTLREGIDAARPQPGAASGFLTDNHTDTTLRNLRQMSRDAFSPFGTQPAPNYIREIFFGVPLQLAWQLQQAGAYLAALDWYQTVYAYNLPGGSTERAIYYGLAQEENTAPVLTRPVHWLIDGLNPHTLAANRSGSNPYTRFTLMSLCACLLEFADSEFATDTAESLARARTLYQTAQRLLHAEELAPPEQTSPDAMRLENPLLALLRLRTGVQLLKMRQGRNIAGVKRQVELPVSLPPGPGDLPILGAGGQLVVPGVAPPLRPTPYYFRVLMERSKQLVTMAQQIEAAYLSALEKLDAERYNLLRAGHDLELARAGEELQTRRIQEAQTGVGVARAQLQRAQVMSEQYAELSATDINAFEQQMVNSFQEAIRLTQQAGLAGSMASLFSGSSAMFSSLAAAAQAMGSWPPNPAAAALHANAGAAAFSGGVAQSQAAQASASAQVAQLQASIYGVFASNEWRRKEYALQAALAGQEVAIAQAQIGAAGAHVHVARQEQRIAQTQLTQAQAIAEFLGRKFTNAELYEWMSGVLGDVYRFFLQQAATMARLAENQLAFERQETPPRFIQSDYWVAPDANQRALILADQPSADRRGLTGSARLLRDMYQLDQYAFDTDKRRLNLSRTFSLSQLAPYEFEQFRRKGSMTFATPMHLFDRDFPGHYLRLIRRVRVSVVALIPPHQGIRATLRSSGFSRVVTGGDTFQEALIRRDPGLVALSSPITAAGVFELDIQSDMQLPFEGMGVDTAWMLEMPRAANPFDFRTIADVLLTIEYTALHSKAYRDQILRTIDPYLSGQRVFSLRNQFADAWYDLHNPSFSPTPMQVRFRTWREDFPAHIDGPAIEQVLLFFSRTADENGELFEVEIGSLDFRPEGASVTLGGSAASIDGMVSTTQGNGSAWTPMIGRTAIGSWTLSLQDTPQLRERFQQERVADILLVISFGGKVLGRG